MTDIQQRNYDAAKDISMMSITQSTDIKIALENAIRLAMNNDNKISLQELKALRDKFSKQRKELSDALSKHCNDVTDEAKSLLEELSISCGPQLNLRVEQAKEVVKSSYEKFKTDVGDLLNPVKIQVNLNPEDYGRRSYTTNNFAINGSEYFLSVGKDSPDKIYLINESYGNKQTIISTGKEAIKQKLTEMNLPEAEPSGYRRFY
ncbi:MAG: hypothetical protein PHE25_05510 [Candidatus Gracilibacteria bacterium]|nr:hypothetical protein [Candidatus Gracilibacteria bacterium]